MNCDITNLLQQANRYKLLTPFLHHMQTVQLTNLNLKSLNVKGRMRIPPLDTKRLSYSIPLKQPHESEEFTGRSSSKLSSSIQVKSERKPNSPMKLHKILSLSQEDCLKFVGDVMSEISRIEVEGERLRSRTISLKNIRISRAQLGKYLSRFYPDPIAEGILRSLKAPPQMTFGQYQQWIGKIRDLDTKWAIPLCFQIYDINNEGEITTNNLLSLLHSSSTVIEQDVLFMVKQTKHQLQIQRESDRIVNVFQNSASIQAAQQAAARAQFETLPASILRCRLDQSVMLQRRQSIIESPTNLRGRTSIFRLSARGSVDLTIENEEPQVSKQPKQLSKSSLKKRQVITMMNDLDENDYILLKEARKKKMKKSSNRISIDLNGFYTIWYPNKPNLYIDFFKRLTQKY